MNWFTGPWRREDDLQEEIRSHLSMAARDRVDDGQDPEAARRASLKEFGNVTLTREATREAWGSRVADRFVDLIREIGYALRVLVRSPGFAIIVILVLALGIGANAAVFTMFKSLALKPLPGVTASSDLGLVAARTTGGQVVPLSYQDYLYVRDHDRTFTGLMGVIMYPFSLGLGNRGERIWGELVTGNYFQVLGVGVRMGRTLIPSDTSASGREPVAVITDGLWRRAFGADPAIVGKTILINAYPITIVGVTPPGFHGSVVSVVMEIFIPVTMQPLLLSPDILVQRQAPFLMAFGRLKPGVSRQAAATQTEALGAELSRENPARERDFNRRAIFLSMWRSPYGAQTYMLPAIVLLFAMGALLLLIVCANVGGLVLVRGIGRRGEVAARLALGASRGRIMRLLFLESFWLVLPGAAAGLALAQLLMPLLLRSSAGGPVPIFFDLSMDGTVIAFAVVISCGSALLFGVVPALWTSRVDLAAVIKDDLSPRGTPKGRLRAALVVSQVAVSLLLLVGARLVARSLDAARHAEVGFDARNIASVSIDVKPNGYDETRGRLLYQQFLDQMGAEPGIEAASLASVWPLTTVDGDRRQVTIEGYQARRDEDLIFLFNVVSPGYLQTLRISLLAGRDFERHDDPSAPNVIIVNETLARRFWGSPRGALGRRLKINAEGVWRTVVGVAHDVKYARVTEDPRPYFYLPFLQFYMPNMTLQVRGQGSPAQLIERVRSRVSALDPNLPILDAKMLSDQAASALGIFEMAARVLGMIGLIATALAALGLYGLIAYTVKQSAHEIGIRMAIGAQPGDIARRFLGRGVRLVVVGMAIGIAGSLAVTRVLKSLLYGVSATDFASFAAASAVVLGVALVASLIPAWRAARTDPIAALRHQ